LLQFSAQDAQSARLAGGQALVFAPAGAKTTCRPSAGSGPHLEVCLRGGLTACWGAVCGCATSGETASRKPQSVARSRQQLAPPVAVLGRVLAQQMPAGAHCPAAQQVGLRVAREREKESDLSLSLGG